MEFDFSFILLHISLLLIIFTIIRISRYENKSQMHYVFLINMGLICAWSIGQIMDRYNRYFHDSIEYMYIYIYFFGACFLPVSIYVTGYIYAKNSIEFKKKHILILIPPVVSYILYITNSYHNLFFIKYASNNYDIVYGMYFPIYIAVMYLYIIGGIYYLSRNIFSKSNLFSIQSLLISLSIFIPAVVNALTVVRVVPISLYSTPIAFSIGILLLYVAISKYNFFDIMPIALEYVVDNISDSYVVINRELKIVDYNKTFENKFSDFVTFDKNTSIIDTIKSYEQDRINKRAVDTNKILKYIHTAIEKERLVTFNIYLRTKNGIKYFFVEITPVIVRQNCIGSVILLKDITDYKKNLRIIRETKKQLVEKEKLASMGNLVGSLAHNLKTSIMSIRGMQEFIIDYIKDYEHLLNINEFDKKAHLDIATQIKNCTERSNKQLNYMSNILRDLRNHTKLFNENNSLTSRGFSISELVKIVNEVVQVNMRKNECVLNNEILVDENTLIYGPLYGLVQIIENLINNSIEAYKVKKGEKKIITLKIEKDNQNILIKVSDNGCGISKDIRQKIFKTMVTTKGKTGTGLGLYLCKSSINAQFMGNIRFESEEDKGTTFIISIPLKDKSEIK